MKKLWILFSMFLIISFCACGTAEETVQSVENLSRAVFANGSLYLDTGSVSTAEGRCGVMDGKITDTVKPDELPIKNDQSNFGTGYEYQMGPNETLEIKIGDEFNVFERQADNKFGVFLTADSVHSTGMTLLIHQKGGESQGELQTGAAYELEMLKDGKWKLVDTINSEAVVWNDIAYGIPNGQEISMEVDWNTVYGALPAGEYRMRKVIMDLRSPGDYDTAESYVYFIVH